MTIHHEDANNIYVQATLVDRIHIHYECPFCWKLKNGRIVDNPFNKKTKRLYMSATPNKHFHGSAGDLSNRTEHRLSHCLVNSEKGVFIVINENTKKLN